MKIHYKTAIVTGASSGIGAAIAKQLCENETKVYGIARSSKKLNNIKNGIAKPSQKNFIPIECDLINIEQTAKAISKIHKENTVDLLICNAGIGYWKSLNEYSWEDVNTVISTNLLGTIGIIKASIENNNKPLHIVCTSSLAGKVGFPNLSIYSASKFAIEGLVDSLRQEYKSSSVRFTILRPGITATNFFNEAGMQEFENSVKGLRSFYSPDKVARIFLNKLTPNKRTITIGNDKYFVFLLPSIPYKFRFNVLDIINNV